MSVFVSSLRRGLLAVLVLFSVACSAGTEPAKGAYVLGTDYKEVRTPQTPADPKRITVEEFFCYCCPHCYHFDPELNNWVKSKPADVDFSRVANSLGRPDGEVQVRAFYIAQTLGIGDKVHTPLFDAIHQKGIPMASLNSIRDLFVQVAGIKPEDFDGVASSFVVDSGLRRAEAESRDYLVTSVPTLVVGGKYAVSGGSAESLKILDFVIDKVRKERKS
jgi:thiol:disulfide interchange protein DsbA